MKAIAGTKTLFKPNFNYYVCFQKKKKQMTNAEVQNSQNNEHAF
jgi:hypothetical protein